MVLPLALAVAGVPADAQDEVPFVVSPEPVTLAMLSIARVGPRDVVLDLNERASAQSLLAQAHRAHAAHAELAPHFVRPLQLAQARLQGTR